MSPVDSPLTGPSGWFAWPLWPPSWDLRWCTPVAGRMGLAFALGLLISLALLAAAARLGMVLVRKFFPGSWPYPWRQGLANLHRPHNQTVVLVLSIGFATFLIMLLYLVHQGLLGQILRAAGNGQPDMVLFDVQGDQKAELADLLQEFGAPCASGRAGGGHAAALDSRQERRPTIERPGATPSRPGP